MPSPDQTAYVNLLEAVGADNLPPGGAAAFERAMQLVEGIPKRIADLGCNTGWTTRMLSKSFPTSEVIGYDISERMISAAKQAANKDGVAPQFQVLDCKKLHLARCNWDLVLSGGSSVFFEGIPSVLRSVRSALSAAGQFIDMHYIYSQQCPVELSIAERESFGIDSTNNTVAERLRTYAEANLRLRDFVTLPRFELTDSPHAAFYRDILSDVLGGEVVEPLIQRRRLAQQLARYRVPVIFVLDTAPLFEQDDGKDEHELYACRRVLELFRTPVPRLPITEIRELSPYGFLAYIGDPDAAPGGSRSVGILTNELRQLGLSRNAEILDVGCFTGLSTFRLALDFPLTTGIDISEESVRVAETLSRHLRSSAKFAVCDARDTGRPAGVLDAVVMTATLGYTPSPAAILKEASRVLRPSGFLCEFLYDYPTPDDSLQRRLRRCVSPFIRLKSLADQIISISRHGFELTRLRRIPRRRIRAEQLDEQLKEIVRYEREENRYLDGVGMREFEWTLRQYAGADAVSVEEEGQVYLSIFRKAELKA